MVVLGGARGKGRTAGTAAVGEIRFEHPSDLKTKVLYWIGNFRLDEKAHQIKPFSCYGGVPYPWQFWAGVGWGRIRERIRGQLGDIDGMA